MDSVAFSTHGLPIMHIIIYMKFSANLVYILFLRTVNFFSPICHLHMPNLHIQILKHVHANELYIWHTQRKSNSYSNDIWHADKQYHSDKNDPQLESCRHFMIFYTIKKKKNNVKSYPISVVHKSYILK